jgi:hypothetical protein
MAQKLNSEFNYRYQVIGETPWAKLQTLKGFLNGRLRARALERVNALKLAAKKAELEHLKSIDGLPHLILNLQAEIEEIESVAEDANHAYRLNEDEIAVLEKLIAEIYEQVEPTRLTHPDGTPYTDDEMFEVNAANEFTATIAKDIYAEILANGRPAPATLRNAMNNPYTFKALQDVGLIPATAQQLLPSTDPLQIELKPTNEVTLPKLVSECKLEK